MDYILILVKYNRTQFFKLKLPFLHSVPWAHLSGMKSDAYGGSFPSQYNFSPASVPPPSFTSQSSIESLQKKDHHYGASEYGRSSYPMTSSSDIRNYSPAGPAVSSSSLIKSGFKLDDPQFDRSSPHYNLAAATIAR